MVVGKVVMLSDLARATVQIFARNYGQQSTTAVMESPNAAPNPAFVPGARTLSVRAAFGPQACSGCLLKPASRPRKRSLFAELMGGVQAMGAHREGRLTLKTRHVHPITVPPVDADIVRGTRDALKMSRHV